MYNVWLNILIIWVNKRGIIMKKIIGNIKILFAFVLGVVIAGTGVYAATIIYNANVISFNTIGTNLTATDLQGAIVELNNEVDTWVDFMNMGTPTNYISDGLNKPTTESPSDYTQVGKDVYLGLYADGQYGVCINRGNNQYCFRNNNYLAEKKHIEKVFSDITCNIAIDYILCEAQDFICGTSSDGLVNCEETNTDYFCEAPADNDLYCGYNE